jgi:SNF2 family DNA or RNA helicase
MDMRFVGQVCKLHDGKRFFGWMLANGVQQGRFGLEFRGGSNALSQIHARIFPEHGVRVRIADIPDFPETQITAEAFDCNGNAKEIQRVYDEMQAELAKINANEKLSPGARQGHVLAQMMYARQKAEMLKVPMVCDMVEDYLENDHSVVVFTNFVQTLDVLCEKLKTKCFVDGRQNEKDRQQCVEDFQNDKEHVIIVNIESGGAGLSLHCLHDRPRASIIFPCWSAISLKQATGRIHRAGGTRKSIQTIVYASGTCEDRVCERVREKLKHIDTINNGDLETESLFKSNK